jgi:hypothetical protein
MDKPTAAGGPDERKESEKSTPATQNAFIFFGKRITYKNFVLFSCGTYVAICLLWYSGGFSHPEVFIVSKSLFILGMIWIAVRLRSSVTMIIPLIWVASTLVTSTILFVALKYLSVFIIAVMVWLTPNPEQGKIKLLSLLLFIYALHFFWHYNVAGFYFPHMLGRFFETGMVYLPLFVLMAYFVFPEDKITDMRLKHLLEMLLFPIGYGFINAFFDLVL